MGKLLLSRKVRFHVIARDSFKCRYCGKSASDTELEVDHIIPLSKGGTHDEQNLATSCKDCNRGKQDSTIFTPNPIKRKNDDLMQANFRIPVEVNQRLKIMATNNKTTSVNHLMKLINDAWDSEDNKETREYVTNFLTNRE